MSILRFDRWCSLAVSGIRFKPDRQEIYEELYAHMEDQYEELTAAGHPGKEAEEEVAAAMGDPGETARQLERIHRPFWGYALRAARCCLVIAAVLTLLILPRHMGGGIHFESLATEREFGDDHEAGEGTDRLVWHSEPRSRDRSDGYTFTLTRAALRRYEGVPESIDGEEILYLLVEVFDPRFWMPSCGAVREFYAVDSLGNVYDAYNLWPGSREEPRVYGSARHTWFCTWTWELRLEPYRSGEADWLELRYTREGRDIRLWLDLPGRDAA